MVLPQLSRNIRQFFGRPLTNVNQTPNKMHMKQLQFILQDNLNVGINTQKGCLFKLFTTMARDTPMEFLNEATCRAGGRGRARSARAQRGLYGGKDVLFGNSISFSHRK